LLTSSAVKRTGYGPEKREAEAEAEPLYYIKRTGYGPEKREASPEAEAEPIYYSENIPGLREKDLVLT
jgi:hypothetical protein